MAALKIARTVNTFSSFRVRQRRMPDWRAIQVAQLARIWNDDMGTDERHRSNVDDCPRTRRLV
jgi:hypothetical protein